MTEDGRGQLKVGEDDRRWEGTTEGGVVTT